MPFPGLSDPFANRDRMFFRALTRDVAIFDRRHFDVQIDPVEERTGNSLPVTLDLHRATAAFAFQIAEVTAGAGVHRHFVKQHYMGFVAAKDHITST